MSFSFITDAKLGKLNVAGRETSFDDTFKCHLFCEMGRWNVMNGNFFEFFKERYKEITNPIVIKAINNFIQDMDKKYGKGNHDFILN